MLPHILPLIPAHDCYVELFAGGASVFFAKRPAAQEVLNDKNGQVANFYRVMKSNFEELDMEIQSTMNCEYTHRLAKSIYACPHHHSCVRQAWAFWVLCNMSYGAGIDEKFQTAGNKRDSWHPARTIAKKRRSFARYLTRMETVTVRCADALDLISTYDQPSTFFYADPPYVGTDQGHYAGYTQEDFDNLMGALNQIEGKFLMSSYPNAALSELVQLQGWNTLHIDQRLGVVADGTQRKTEVLTWNYNLETPQTLFS